MSAPLSGFGWESRLVFAEVRSKGQYSTSDDVGRIEGSGIYSINEMFRLKAGLNVAKLVGSASSYYNPGIGGQVGVTAQANSTLGVELSYVASQMETKESNYRGDKTKATLEGLELGVTATF